MEIKNNKSPKNEPDEILPKEKVCFNCIHMLWCVGVGQGMRCSKQKENGSHFLIPNSRYSCDLFENKH
jgi:hypothetical protein